VFDLLRAPLWLVALLAAAAAPFVAGALQMALAARVRRRSEDLVARALGRIDARGTTGRGGPGKPEPEVT
jgi:hypothetical protein